MKKVYILTFVLMLLLSSYCVATVANDKNETIISPSQEVIVSSESEMESGELISVDNIEEVSDNEENPILGFLINTIEALILILIIVKTFKYINESGKLFSETIEKKKKYCKELPFDDITPGQAVVLKDMNYASKGNIFSGSLLNLKLKGFLGFSYVGNEKIFENMVIRLTDNEKETLIGEEKVIYDFLLEFANKFQKEDGYISLYAMQKYISNNRERVNILKKDIEQAAKLSLSSYDGRADIRVRRRTADIFIYVFLLILMPILHTGKLDIFSFHTWISIMSIVNTIHCIRIVSKTKMFGKEGASNREKIKGFERYLKDFAQSKELGLPEISIWDYYIVFAMAFGIAPKVLKQVMSSYPNIEDSNFMETFEICQNLLKCDFNKKFMSAR